MPNITEKKLHILFLYSFVSQVFMSSIWALMFARVSHFCNTDDIVDASNDTLEFILSEAFLIAITFQKIADQKLTGKRKALLTLLVLMSASPLLIVYFLSSERLQTVVENAGQNTTESNHCISSPDNVANGIKLFIILANNVFNLLFAKPWLDLFLSNSKVSPSDGNDESESLMEEEGKPPKTPERCTPNDAPPAYSPTDQDLIRIGGSPLRITEARMKNCLNRAGRATPERTIPSIGFRFSPPISPVAPSQGKGEEKSIREWLEEEVAKRP